MLSKMLVEVVNESVDEELIGDEIDGILDKLVEQDIWRECVKDIRVEQEAVDELVVEWVDQCTR